MKHWDVDEFIKSLETPLTDAQPRWLQTSLLHAGIAGSSEHAAGEISHGTGPLGIPCHSLSNDKPITPSYSSTSHSHKTRSSASPEKDDQEPANCVNVVTKSCSDGMMGRGLSHVIPGSHHALLHASHHLGQKQHDQHCQGIPGHPYWIMTLHKWQKVHRWLQSKEKNHVIAPNTFACFANTSISLV